ncbi:MAG: nitroreductase family protein [Myxococcaceae bacterium]
MTTSSFQKLLRYHLRSKHRSHAFAPGPGGLDWASQPEPFRKFVGAPSLQLPLAADALGTSFSELRCAGAVPPRPVDLPSLALLFELSFAISAWKELGASRWALRCNPSSGNLHPIEAYLACPALQGLEAGVHHYDARSHSLDRRAAPVAPGWSEAFRGAGVLVGLSSIDWREAWKYGIRAYRYSELDAGHAIASLRYAAAALGWTARVLDSPSDEEVGRLLGLDRPDDFPDVERERPVALLWVGPRTPAVELNPLLCALGDASWTGVADSPSVRHLRWEDIEEVAAAAAKERSSAAPWEPAAESGAAPEEVRSVTSAPTAAEASASASSCSTRPLAKTSDSLPAATLIRQRRSALAFDAQTRISAAQFFTMLEALQPRRGLPPCDALPWEPRVHLFIFVHRVKSLPMGLYAACRTAAAEGELRAATRDEFIWQPVEGAPEQLRLRLLLPLDLRKNAEHVACGQEIAGDGAFAVAFVSRWRASVEETPSWYPRLFREAGLLGQALYLEAEAAGVRATGIGCFFDDELHRLLGMSSDAFQALYMLAVGGPVEDRRLASLPAYSDRITVRTS